jgi:subtilisin family serine protease
MLASDSAPEFIDWRGEQVFTFRDNYVVKMAESATETSDTPLTDLRPGWTARSLGWGLHQLRSPGASVQDVMAWADTVGAVEIAPEAVLEKTAAAVVPNDTFYGAYQWGLNNSGKVPFSNSPEGVNFPRVRDADIDMPEAWNFRPEAPIVGTKQIVVAILDDGIDYRHPDLQANIWDRDAPTVPQQALVNGVMTPVSAITQRFGYDSFDDSLDDRERAQPLGSGVEGYTTLPWRFGTTVGINNSHGTHIAGIIGAQGGNGVGPTSSTGSMVGVNWAVSLYSAKIFPDAGAGTAYSTGTAFLDAVRRIVDLKRFYNQNFVVANASFYQYSSNAAMQQAVNLLAANDILLVAAAGNGRHQPCAVPTDGVGDKTTNPEQCVDQPVFPANLTGAPVDNVIAVASSTSRDTLSRFSNWGPDVDIAAPGENIWSTVPRSATRTGSYWMHESVLPPGDWEARYRNVPSQMLPGDVLRVHGGYASMSGTSMSAAYVSGVAAFVAAHYLRITKVLPSVTFLRNAILNGADSVPSLRYQEQSGAPRNGNPGYHPDDMFAPFPIDGNISDPFPGRVHSIAGDRRLNAYGAVKWAYDNLPPKITVTGRTEPRTTEGDPGVPRPLTFTYELDKTPAVAITVAYWTEQLVGQATSGVDYVAISQASPQTFTIPVGARRGTFSVGIIPDLISEPNEGFRIRMAMAPNQNAWLASDFAIGVILDDDGDAGAPATTIDTPWVTVAEGNGGSVSPTLIYVPVAIGPASARPVSLDYRIAPLQAQVIGPDGLPVDPATTGADFVALAGTINVPAGSTSARIPVRIIGDVVPQNGGTESAREGFVVQLIEPRPGKLKDWRSAVTVIIVDDDIFVPPDPPPTAPGVQIAAVTQSVTEGAAASFSISTTVPVAVGWTMTVFFQTVSGTAIAGRDFQAITSGRVVMGGGQSQASVTVQTLRDRFAEPAENFSVRISNVVYQQIGSPQRLTVPVFVREAVTTINDPPSASTVLSRAALFAAAAGQLEQTISTQDDRRTNRR